MDHNPFVGVNKAKHEIVMTQAISMVLDSNYQQNNWQPIRSQLDEAKHAPLRNYNGPDLNGLLLLIMIERIIRIMTLVLTCRHIGGGSGIGTRHIRNGASIVFLVQSSNQMCGGSKLQIVQFRRRYHTLNHHRWWRWRWRWRWKGWICSFMSGRPKLGRGQPLLHGGRTTFSISNNDKIQQELGIANDVSSVVLDDERRNGRKTKTTTTHLF